MDAYTISNANFKNGKPASFQMWKPANGGYPSYRENNPGGGSRSLTQVSTQRTPVCEYSAYPGLGSLAQAEWPSGGTAAKGAAELFDLLAEWDAKNYVVCAGTGAGA